MSDAVQPPINVISLDPSTTGFALVIHGGAGGQIQELSLDERRNYSAGLADAYLAGEAVLEAGAVRFRPIALTAAAVVIGGLVMVLDPIFQGLAVALMSGAVVATLLTMIVVPLLYWELRRRSQFIPPKEHSHV